jgi:hypothetical protein
LTSIHDAAHSSPGAWIPESEAERAAIGEQLERILSSPLFKNSKRYPTLLRFVVERSLHGHSEPLKERVLGVEVFGRPSDYDTNLDPVVRTTAVEIRKRIAQYYHEPGHETEIRIDFPPGSYVPEFRMPQKPAVAAVSEPRAPTRRALIAVLAVAAVVALAVVLVARPWAARPAIDSFWEPVLNSPDPVSIYIGGYPSADPPVSLRDLQNSEMVAYADATALARVTAFLVSHNHPYRMRLQISSKLEDLKDGPAILIGAFNNSFALRLTGQLRFGFIRDPATDTSGIGDRQNPQSTKWSHVMNAPYTGVRDDYAILSRVVDPLTGRVVVTASGLAKFGTEAAGEFLTSRSYMEEIAKGAPVGWDRRNIQIVIGTNAVGRSSGPPHVIATYFW